MDINNTFNIKEEIDRIEIITNFKRLVIESFFPDDESDFWKLYLLKFCTNFSNFPGMKEYTQELLQKYIASQVKFESGLDEILYIMIEKINSFSQDMFEMIIELGADMNFLADLYFYPIVYKLLHKVDTTIDTDIDANAQIESMVNFVKFFVLQGASLKGVLHEMIKGIKHFPLNSFKTIIELGADVNELDIMLHTPLHMIPLDYENSLEYINHIVDVVKLFISKGANLNSLDICNMTVLQNALVSIPTLHKYKSVKIFIVKLLNAGATYSHLDYVSEDVEDFIVSYKLRNIKSAKIITTN